MGLAYHNQNTGTAFDDSVDGWIRRRSPRLMNDLVHLADPLLIAVLFTILIAVACLRRRWDVALLAFFTPVCATLLVEQVLKPWIHRTQSDPYIVHTFGYEPLAFPSGHETGIGSLVAVLGLLVLTSRWSNGRRTLVVAVMLLVDAIAAIGLVGRYYHYTTDTVGAFLVCVAVTLIVALVVDAVLPRGGPGQRLGDSPS
jgi:membrane-associated phospholipid phosphatase